MSWLRQLWPWDFDWRATPSVCALFPVWAGGRFAERYLIFYADHYKLWMPAGAGVLTFVGLYWLYADFINADPRPEK